MKKVFIIINIDEAGFIAPVYVYWVMNFVVADCWYSN